MEPTPCSILCIEGIKVEIGEFSCKTGLTIDTLRYYNKIGLLEPVKINNRRHYTEDDLEKAVIIIKLKNLNFTLDEIRILFDLDKDVDESKALDNESRIKVKTLLNMIEEKQNEILKKEQDLIQIKAILEKMIYKTNKLLETGRFVNIDNSIQTTKDKI